MKTRSFIITVLVAICSIASAQDNVIRSKETFPVTLEGQSELLKQMIPEINTGQITLRLRFFNKSNYSKHFTYDVLYNQLAVFTNFIKVNTDVNNKIISIAKGIGNYQNYAAGQFSWERSVWEGIKKGDAHWMPNEKVKKRFYAIYEFDGLPAVVQVQEAWSKTYDKTKLISLAGQVVGEWDHERNLGIDTFINADVFEPDPLTFLTKVYGTPYVDSNDQDLTWMTAAYLPVNIPAVYDTFVNKFFIESDYVKMQDLEPPSIAPSSSANNNFYFNRSQPGFEECMVAYHINVFHNHLTALGYDTLMDLQLEADAHGQFGADNSVFNRNGGSPTIIFGDGGIDDAEDADVIIHEYSHGISWSANANTFFGTERPALDEGIGDYFATSYSRHLSPFKWEKVFTWDGNNGNWQGRIANTATNYSNPFSGNLYALGEVWNAAMQKIYTDLGRNTTDELMLETLFFLTDNSSLTDAARYMMQADTLLNGGVNAFTICQHFASKNILAWDCFPVSVSETKSSNRLVKVINSYGFSTGTANVVFQLNTIDAATLQLFDMNGSLLRTEKFSNALLELSPDVYSTGIYIAKIVTSRGIQTVKLSRK